jgi:hypothetical protein
MRRIAYLIYTNTPDSAICHKRTTADLSLLSCDSKATVRHCSVDDDVHEFDRQRVARARALPESDAEQEAKCREAARAHLGWNVHRRENVYARKPTVREAMVGNLICIRVVVLVVDQKKAQLRGPRSVHVESLLPHTHNFASRDLIQRRVGDLHDTVLDTQRLAFYFLHLYGTCLDPVRKCYDSASCVGLCARGRHDADVNVTVEVAHAYITTPIVARRVAHMIIIFVI